MLRTYYTRIIANGNSFVKFFLENIGFIITFFAFLIEKGRKNQSIPWQNIQKKKLPHALFCNILTTSFLLPNYYL